MTNIPRSTQAEDVPQPPYLEERSALARKLRQLRRDAGLTGDQLARLVGFSQSKISKIENEKLIPNVEDVTRLVEALGGSDDVLAELVDHAETLLTEFNSWRMLHRRGLRWKQEQFLEMEASAGQIRIFQPALVPGLLQTSEYARQVLARADVTGSGDADDAVSTRMKRQWILHDSGKSFEFVITEAALRWRFASPTAMAIQAEYVQSMSRLDNVTIRVIPFSAEVPLIPYNSFCIFDDRAVTVETFSAEMHIREPRDVSLYATAFDTLMAAAGDEAETRALLGAIVEDLATPREVAMAD